MKPLTAETFLDGKITLHCGDALAVLRTLPADHFDCCITSPPYWGLRDYGVADQLGLEPTLGEHIEAMVGVFREVRRVLKPQGTFWLNYGDCYATHPNGRSAADTKAAGYDDRTFRDKPFSTIGPIATGSPKRAGRSQNKGNTASDGVRRNFAGQGYLKPKDLCMIPNRLAIALQDDGWWVRAECIWGKSNPMPDSSGRWRPGSAHEKVFMLSKSANCYYDANSVRQRAAYANSGRTSATKADLSKDRKRNGDDGNAASFRAIVENRLLRNFERAPDKQRGHSRRHAGFNDRWDHMSRSEQIADGYLLRNYEPADLSVWEIPTSPFAEAHFATFPVELADRCIMAGCPEGGQILDPFGGAGTVGLAAAVRGRSATLIELNPNYARLAQGRIEAAFMGRGEGACHLAKSIGKPIDHGPLFAEPDYDADKDFAGSLQVGYDAIRERQASGGKWWEPE